MLYCSLFLSIPFIISVKQYRLRTMVRSGNEKKVVTKLEKKNWMHLNHFNYMRPSSVIILDYISSSCCTECIYLLFYLFLPFSHGFGGLSQISYPFLPFGIVTFLPPPPSSLQWTPKDSQAYLKINGRCDDVVQRLCCELCLEIPEYKQ